MTEAVIQVDKLSKTYHDGVFRAQRIEALRGVSFEVEQGEIFGLLGPNGAGKTTFIKILLGIIRKSGGQASLMGYGAGDRRGRRKVGYLPENLVVPRHHSGKTALEYYGQLSGMSMAEVLARRDDLLDLVGLASRADDKVGKYSKGMQQRLGLAQALVHDPQLLILDEPTDGLDPVGRAQIRALLAGLRNEGKTIFLNSHLLQEVELICDRVAILDRGQLKRVGPVEEMTSGGHVAGGDKDAQKQVPLIELELELSGQEQPIREALAGRQVEQLSAMQTGRFRVKTVLADQAAVDRCIDDLRQAGISIVRLTPRRASLEEVFLQAVSDKVEKDEQNSDKKQ